MFRMKINDRKQWLVFIIALTGMIGNVTANALGQDDFSSGSRWLLNINGKQDTMVLIKGSSKPLSSRGFSLQYKIKWGGRSGTLSGRGSAKDPSLAVNLSLNSGSGQIIKCHGFSARDTDDFMAGICDDKSAPGAWSATRLTSTSKNKPVIKKQTDSNSNKSQKCRSKLKRVIRNQKVRQDKYNNTMNDLKRCRAKRDALMKQPQGSAFAPYSAIRKNLSVSCQNCLTVNVSSSGFPSMGVLSKSQDTRWLQRHNSGLLDTLRIGGFSSSDITDFHALERNACKGNSFCEAGYRQQAIYLMLGGG